MSGVQLHPASHHTIFIIVLIHLEIRLEKQPAKPSQTNQTVLTASNLFVRGMSYSKKIIDVAFLVWLKLTMQWQ